MGLMSKRKGRAGEQEAVRSLTEAFGDIATFARNSMQAHGVAVSGNQSDILTNLPYAFEVKRTEDFKPKPWIEQARRQVGTGCLPVVMHRSNGEPWRFLFELHGPEFIRMVRAIHAFNKLPQAVQAHILAGPARKGSDLLTSEGTNAAE